MRGGTKVSDETVAEVEDHVEDVIREKWVNNPMKSRWVNSVNLADKSDLDSIDISTKQFHIALGQIDWLIKESDSSNRGTRYRLCDDWP